MKKLTRLLPLLLLLLLLGGCEVPESLRMKGVDTDALLRRIRNEPDPAPTAEPTPSPTPRPGGAQGRVLDLLEALARDDRAAVRDICDTIPGYRTAEEIESGALRALYTTAYRNLSWRFLGGSEGNASATVELELTVPDLRGVIGELSALWETAPPTGDRAAAADEALLSLLESAPEETRRHRVSVGLSKEDGRWVVDGSAELYNALTGSLEQALTDFDLPAEKPVDVEMGDGDKSLRHCLSDNFLFSLVVVEVLPNAPEGYTLRAEAVNKSSGPIVISARDVMINGYVMPQWHQELQGGERRTVSLVWDRGELAERGVGSVKNIAFELSGFQKAAWPVYPSVTQPCIFCPNGYSADTTPLPTAEGEQRLLDHWAAGFTVLRVDYEGCWGCTITVAIENRCGEALWFSVGDAAVNGVEYSAGWSQTLPVGGRSVERIRIPAGELMLRDASRADTVDFHVYVSSLNNLEYKDGGVSARGHYTLYAPE